MKRRESVPGAATAGTGQPDDAVIRTEIRAQRNELAALLADLPDERWDAATLCSGWRVREVVSHLTMPFRLSLPGFVVGLIRARGNFHRMADRWARQDAAARSPRELAAVVAANVDHPWRPPGGGYGGALAHDVIHGLDITVPLGLGHRLPPERVRLVLAGLTARNKQYFGVDLSGIQLRADDLDWTLGTGTPLTGRAQDLLLVVCGRRLPAGRLNGSAAARFTSG